MNGPPPDKSFVMQVNFGNPDAKGQKPFPQGHSQRAMCTAGFLMTGDTC